MQGRMILSVPGIFCSLSPRGMSVGLPLITPHCAALVWGYRDVASPRPGVWDCLIRGLPLHLVLRLWLRPTLRYRLCLSPHTALSLMWGYRDVASPRPGVWDCLIRGLSSHLVLRLRLSPHSVLRLWLRPTLRCRLYGVIEMRPLRGLGCGIA